ncbi:helix-turn-helix domain-containing protein [Streptomyces longisporoflavus]|uniref:Helix-turn-helix domain-containing protein n=1 Tax=Streptomyces longisporoflavus TaxID=28044 RepID=A0ABW7QZD4_9ACTN
MRTAISERQHRLGHELKKLREQAGLSAGEAAERINMGRGQLSHVEAGRTSIVSDRLRDLCAALGCESVPYVDALVAMSEATGKGWWSAYKGNVGSAAMNLAELEAGATVLRSHESLFIPGLLQTEEYMRAIFANPQLGVSDMDEAAAFRLERQSVLTSENPPEFHGVIHEAALHMRFGGASVLRGQLLHLVEVARLPNVTIQVVPFEADVDAALSGAFLHSITPVHRLSTVVLDHPSGPVYLRDDEHLALYGSMFDRLTECALAPITGRTHATLAAKDSLALIQHLLYTL